MTEDQSALKAAIEMYQDDFDTSEEEADLPVLASHDNLQLAMTLKSELSKELFGQEQAIATVVNSVKNSVRDQKGPMATYLFLGSPATGKTFLAELMTKHLPKYKILQFDMTQYHQQNGGELYGYPPGWKGYGVGQLTGFVHRNPKSIIVLDAFEKCDNVIQSNLLSIFEGGKMRDNCGWDRVTDEPCNENEDTIYNESNANYMVDFRECIFIITSSIGKELYLDYRFKELIKKDYIRAESMILEAIKRERKRDSRSGGTEEAIVPELISRFSKAHIVLFNRLEYDAFEKIASTVFTEYIAEFKKLYGIDFVRTRDFEEFVKLQILNYAPELDARRIKDKVSTVFFNRITDHILHSGKQPKEFKEIRVSFSKAAKQFIAEKVNPLIEDDKLVRELFRKNISLEMDDTITDKNGVITYKMNSCRFKQVIRIKDFSEDGLVFDIPRISFDDIAGHHVAKQRLREVINFFKDPELLENFDISSPKGMLLYGPPGTGKTMLAKAFAKEAELPFISTTGLELLQPEKTRQIFSKAKEYAPAIIFIDEIDTIGRRGEGNGREVPINKLLSEMDGFSGHKDENIFVIAATNYKENIDEAIIRPGRVEIHIEINNLDKDARQYFLEKIIKDKPTKGRFDMNKLLMYTTGFTGSQLELLGKEASFHCLRHGLPAITQDILIDHINRIKYGDKMTYLSPEEMFEETSVYQAGRAVVSKLLMPHVHIDHISLTPEANNEHFVSHDYHDVQENMTVKDFKDRISVALAGRTAQMKKFGAIDGLNTGATNDLQQATRDAYAAIAYYGMDKEVGYININGVLDAKNNALHNRDTEHYHEQIDTALERWMLEGEKSTTALVNEQWKTIEKLSALLLEKEIIYEAELDAILAK
jgi:ATP-dependent Zn protease